MIGQKFQKPLTDTTAYSEAAAWANANSAMIVDMGNYYEVVTILEPTSEQQAAAIRAERNARIAEADIAINKTEDAGQDTAALRAYRQALRDVPQQAGFPNDVVWPTCPDQTNSDSPAS